MMERITGECWNVQDNLYRLQIKTKCELRNVEDKLPGWTCVSFGYVPSTGEEILVFEREFKSKKDWTNFTKTDTIIKLIELREV
jgi:hypothetical protein